MWFLLMLQARPGDKIKLNKNWKLNWKRRQRQNYLCLDRNTSKYYKILIVYIHKYYDELHFNLPQAMGDTLWLCDFCPCSFAQMTLQIQNGKSNEALWLIVLSLAKCGGNLCICSSLQSAELSLLFNTAGPKKWTISETQAIVFEPAPLSTPPHCAAV